jgi:hypothetical protein
LTVLSILSFVSFIFSFFSFFFFSFFSFSYRGICTIELQTDDRQKNNKNDYDEGWRNQKKIIDERQNPNNLEVETNKLQKIIKAD